jgi:hypothetical protein
LAYRYVDTLNPGNAFRDWLVEKVVWNRIQNKNCLVDVFKFDKGADWKAEPYIGHFLWEYSKDEKDFTHITRVLPFFISIGLLRSARINQGSHRDYLIREAQECLKVINKG